MQYRAVPSTVVQQSNSTVQYSFMQVMHTPTLIQLGAHTGITGTGNMHPQQLQRTFSASCTNALGLFSASSQDMRDSFKLPVATPYTRPTKVGLGSPSDPPSCEGLAQEQIGRMKTPRKLGRQASTDMQLEHKHGTAVQAREHAGIHVNKNGEWSKGRGKLPLVHTHTARIRRAPDEWGGGTCAAAGKGSGLEMGEGAGTVLGGGDMRSGWQRERTGDG
jgi:hypothetical protein